MSQELNLVLWRSASKVTPHGTLHFNIERCLLGLITKKCKTKKNSESLLGIWAKNLSSVINKIFWPLLISIFLHKESFKYCWSLLWRCVSHNAFVKIVYVIIHCKPWWQTHSLLLAAPTLLQALLHEWGSRIFLSLVWVTIEWKKNTSTTKVQLNLLNWLIKQVQL